MEQLINKLAKAKAIMDKSDTIRNGNAQHQINDVNLETFNAPNARYNIPPEMISESSTFNKNNVDMSVLNVKPVGVPTFDAIKNSKLPDEIKKIMLEHPISQPQQQVTLSDDLLEKAAKLMNNGNSTAKKTNVSKNEGVIDYNVIKEMINEAVKSAMKESGLLVESTEKTNDVFTFKVGKHIFEGKLTKIKKLS